MFIMVINSIHFLKKFNKLFTKQRVGGENNIEIASIRHKPQIHVKIKINTRLIAIFNHSARNSQHNTR